MHLNDSQTFLVNKGTTFQTKTNTFSKHCVYFVIYYLIRRLRAIDTYTLLVSPETFSQNDGLGSMIYQFQSDPSSQVWQW